jgi:hypothetical protein
MAQSPLQPTSPKTIILALWPTARDEQINYYTAGYQTLYPSATILQLPQSTTGLNRVLNDLLNTDEPSFSFHDSEKSSAPDARSNDIILHLFGDDAASQASRLLSAYQLRTQRPLPIAAVIHDSTPSFSLPSFQLLRRSPLTYLTALISTLLILIWQFLRGTLSIFLPISTTTNATQIYVEVLPGDVQRCYVLPEKKLMFSWSDPAATTTTTMSQYGDDDNEDDYEDEDEIKDDEATVAQRDDFVVDRSRVGCGARGWSGDQERYWAAVEKAWEGKR